MKKKVKEGKKIIPAGVYPEKHEHETAEVFLHLGEDVEFIKPSRTKGSRSADVFIYGVAWEMKALFGSSKNSIGDNIGVASRQSPNVILDVRHFTRSEKYIVSEVTKQFSVRRKVRKLLVILKSNKIIDFHR